MAPVKGSRIKSRLSHLTPEERLEHQRARIRRNRLHNIERNPDYYRKRYNAEDDRNYSLKGMYGITHADYDRILKEQGGCCGICGTRAIAAQGHKHGHIDHDHSKKKGEVGFIRGILCHNCNAGGGKFRDDPGLLRRAADWFSRGLPLS